MRDWFDMEWCGAVWSDGQGREDMMLKDGN